MVLELKTKQQLAKEANSLARSFELVRYRSTLYIPADFETLETSVVPDADRTIWLPLNRDQIRQIASAQYDTLFANDSELSSFFFMVAQNAEQQERHVTSMLVRTPAGLQELDEFGTLFTPSGGFLPNYVQPMLNEDAKEKKRVRKVIDQWLDSSEEAESLLKHLATSLAPGYPAIRYVLLLGEGRNGKSLLMKMLEALYGQGNVSHVTRQDIAERSPTVTDLNGKLLNVVYDGSAEYLRDSGAEKTLIAGEPYPIRRLYESAPTMVQSNALFIEGLQHEPKTKDKSRALQKRLVRFHFPNVYADDHKFERQMLSEKSLGALLALLIEHYVKQDDVATALAPTTKAIELQLEHMFVNSIGLQFLKYLDEGPGLDEILGEEVAKLVKTFGSWRLKENDLSTWSEPDIMALFLPLLVTERRSVRVAGQPRKVRVVVALKNEAAAFIESLKGEKDVADQALLDTLVDD